MRSTCHLCRVRGLMPNSAAKAVGSRKAEPTTSEGASDVARGFFIVIS